MRHGPRRVRWLIAALGISAVLAGGAAGAGGDAPCVTVTTDFASPLFGLNDAPGKGLLVADAGAGPTLVRNGEATLIAPLPGVNDVLQIGSDGYLATVTGRRPGSIASRAAPRR